MKLKRLRALCASAKAKATVAQIDGTADDSQDQAPPDAATAEDGDRETRLLLLRESYKEVLAATTHTDDKIGRLLTGLAFLTAASLAASGLSSSVYFTADFDLQRISAPVAVIALGAFLVSVLFAVLILVSAFSTPLRLPTTSRIAGRKEIRWAKSEAGTEIKGSPIYFNEISKLTVEQWREKSNIHISKMLDERQDSYIYEVHNLALRAHHKSRMVARASEFCILAVAALALSFIFTLSAAAQRTVVNSPPIALGLTTAIPMAAVLGFVVYLNLYSRLRETCDEASMSRNWYIVYPIFTALGTAIVAVPPIGAYTATWKLVATVIVTALTAVSLGLVFSSLNRHASGQEQGYESGRSKQIAGLATTVSIGLGAALLSFPWPEARALGYHMAMIFALLACVVTTFRLPRSGSRR